MAGRPRTRAKREAEAARQAGLAPVAFVDGAAPGADAPVIRDMKAEFLADRRRPTVAYSEEVATEVLIAIACGLSLTHLCELEGMPSKRSLYYWRRDNKKFSEAFDDALRFRADGRLNLIDGLIEAVTAGQLDPIAARVALDAHKWLAGKENYKYSDTQNIQLTGRDGGPVQVQGDPVQQRELARWLALILVNGERATRQLELQAGEYEAIEAKESANG